MNTLSKWLQKRKQERGGLLRSRGYDFAAGELLRGTTRDRLESVSLYGRTAFDEGVDNAIRDWEKKVGEVPEV